MGQTTLAARLGRADFLWDAALFALVVLTAAFVLSFPTFPTQDGPVHLYYADVLRAVLTHSGPYAQHFAIKTLFTPYVLEYVALLLLESVFSAPMSEKLLLCGYIFAFGFAIRYLAGSVESGRSPWTLAAMPFCLHILLYLGFVNYCFGVTALLFLSGYWIRHAGLLSARHIVTLIAGFLLMLLIHPLPPAIFLAFAALYLAALLLRKAVPAKRPALTWLALAALGVACIAPFRDTAPHGPALPSYRESMGWVGAMMAQLELRPALPFTPLMYRVGPILLLAAVVLAVVWSMSRTPAAMALLATSAAGFLLFIVAPLEVNGGWNFPERFPIVAILFLIAAAAALHPPKVAGIAVSALAILVTVGVLYEQWLFASKVADDVAGFEEAAVAKPGSVGLIIGPLRSAPPELAFDPYTWASAAYFRNSHAVMANAPWMDTSTILLKPVAPDRFSYRGPVESLRTLQEMALGGELAPQIDFVVENPPFDNANEQMLHRMGFTEVSQAGEYYRVFHRR